MDNRLKAQACAGAKDGLRRNVRIARPRPPIPTSMKAQVAGSGAAVNSTEPLTSS